MQSAREAVEEVADLLDGAARDPSTEVWLASCKRLSDAMQAVAAATYYLREWPEPDDAERDEPPANRRGLHSWR